MDKEACCCSNSHPHHKKLFIFLVLIVLPALYFRFVGPIPLSINSVVSNKADLFTVSGEGKVSIVPDVVNINLGISVNQTTIKSAQQQANLVIKKIQDDLKKLGIKDENIKTVNYNINPSYDWTSGKGRIIGYEVTTNLSVGITDFEKINSVIDTATTDGANLVGNLQFSVNDNKLKELKSKARKLAIEEAKVKAQDLAKASGLKLGKLVNVTENQDNQVIRPIYAELKAVGGAPTDTQTKITPGEQDITSSVILSYETL
jgi:uncharacterized protein